MTLKWQSNAGWLKMSDKKDDRKRFGITLPEGLVEIIDKIVAENPEYRTRTDFVIKAIQSLVLEYRKLYPDKFRDKDETTLNTDKTD